MIVLPDGRRVGKINIHPKNWQEPDADVKKEWYITYRIYSSEFPQGRPVQIRGMNRCLQWKDRKKATQDLLYFEMKRLNDPEILEQEVENGLSPKTSLEKALAIALTKIVVEESTRKDIGYVVKAALHAAKRLNIAKIAISTVTKKHIRLILDNCGENNPRFTNNTFNHYIKYLRILFVELSEMDAVVANP